MGRKIRAGQSYYVVVLMLYLTYVLVVNLKVSPEMWFQFFFFNCHHHITICFFFHILLLKNYKMLCIIHTFPNWATWRVERNGMQHSKQLISDQHNSTSLESFRLILSSSLPSHAPETVERTNSACSVQVVGWWGRRVVVPQKRRMTWDLVTPWMTSDSESDPLTSVCLCVNWTEWNGPELCLNWPGNR